MLTCYFFPKVEAFFVAADTVETIKNQPTICDMHVAIMVVCTGIHGTAVGSSLDSEARNISAMAHCAHSMGTCFLHSLKQGRVHVRQI